MSVFVLLAHYLLLRGNHMCSSTKTFLTVFESLYLMHSQSQLLQPLFAFIVMHINDWLTLKFVLRVSISRLHF